MAFLFSKAHRAWFYYCKQNLGLARLFDLNCDFLVVAGRSGTHNGADRLGNTALFADYSAHIVLADVKVVNRYALLVGFIYSNRYCGRILDKTLCDCD